MDFKSSRTLLKMGRYQQAYEAYTGDLAGGLFTNLEAYAEILSLLRFFFPQGWATLPKAVAEQRGSYLANSAAISLAAVDEPEESFAAHGASLAVYLRGRDWTNLSICMQNTSETLCAQNRLAQEHRCLSSNLRLATLGDYRQIIFRARQYSFLQLARIGQVGERQSHLGSP